ncbi:MAG: Mrp/NBP35 family ATP-binding protein [Phycisphaerales bacterium]
MPLSSRDLHDALRTVKDPDLRKDLVTLNMIADVQVDGPRVGLTVELAAGAGPTSSMSKGEELRDRLRADIVAAVRAKAAERGERVDSIEVNFAQRERKPNEQVRDGHNPLPNVRNVIAVGAGKGGVGKSTVATLLACGLARTGAAVGLLDGDIYGPSMPTMLGLEDVPTQARGNMLLPFAVHGIKAMSIGKLVEPDKALIWRGPMAHGAFKQLAMQTEWGALDHLVIDLPPGTGDVSLTLAQLLPLTGAIIVCTPQRVAQDDARRAVRMFQQLGVEVLGVVENMSWFVGDDGREYDLFGRGGAEIMAQTMNIPFLGALPITMALRENCDTGTPLRNWDDAALAARIDRLCANTVDRIALAAAGGRTTGPTLSVR